MNGCFHQAAAEDIDTSETILHKVRFWRDCVRKGDGSDYSKLPEVGTRSLIKSVSKMESI